MDGRLVRYRQRCVARGELLGLLLALATTRGHLCYVTDNFNVADGFWNEHHLAPPPGALQDVWTRIGKVIASRPGSVSLFWTYSHLSEAEAKFTTIPLALILGNAGADGVADTAALEYRLPGPDREEVIANERLVAAIRRRGMRALQAVLEAAPEEGQRAGRMATPKVSRLATAASESSHTLISIGPNAWKCRLCRGDARGKKAFLWLHSPCPSKCDEGSWGEVPERAPRAAVNGVRPHASHAMTLCAPLQLWWCEGCGRYAADRVFPALR